MDGLRLCARRSRAEAEFLIYAARPNARIVRLPTDTFAIEKTVVSYLRYLDDLEKRFLRKFCERTLNHAEAETLTRRARAASRHVAADLRLK
jgi:hypothetical protein